MESMITAPPPIKVAYILKMFPRFSETFILCEILELEREGVEVHVFSLKRPNDGHTHADVARVRAPVTYVPITRVIDGIAMLGAHARVFAWDPVRYLRIAARVARRRRWGAVKRFMQAGYIAPCLKREGITHVHAHFASSATSVAYYLRHLMDMSYSFTAHAKDIYIDSVSEEVLLRKLNNARFVVTVSDYNHEHLTALSPHARIRRIYNGLDLSQFTPNGHYPEENPLILAVGRLVEKKGFDVLIRACAILRHQGARFSCKIAGTGEEASALQALIERLELTKMVELVGAMPRERLIDLYPRASVVVAPCVVGTDGNRDGLPTVLIEAMALGVPVVSTPVTGIPELVRHEETGLLVSPRNPVELAKAIDRSIRHKESAREMAVAGRRLVEFRFDIRRNVSQLRELFQEASEAA